VKAEKAFLKAKDEAGHFSQVMKRFQSIKGITTCSEKTLHQRFVGVFENHMLNKSPKVSTMNN
jgi:hypothetical protein